MDNDAKTIYGLRHMLGDRNLRFPLQPRLISDINIFQMPDGLGIQFRGGEMPVIVRGRQAESTLAFLLPALDGTRTLDDLLEQCPQNLSRATMLQTLALLHTKGLLVGGKPTSEALEVGTSNAATIAQDEIMCRQLLFWGRHLDVTRNARSADEVQRRLATSRLVLVGTGLFGAITYDILTRSGCADIRALDWDDDGLFLETLAGGATQPRQAIHLSTVSIDEAASWLRGWAEDADLVITATRNAPWALFRAINRICLDRDCPWLCANVAATQIEVGPYVRPYGSACFACMELRLASAQDFSIEERLYQEHLAEPRPAGQTLPVGESLFASTLAASLLVGEVVRVVTGVAASTLLNGVLTVSPLNGSFQVNRILRVPRCPECFRGALAPPNEREPYE